MDKESATIRALVVEDNIGDFVLVEEYMHEQFEKAEAVHASTYQRAVNALKEEKDPFDVILLDLSLPDKNGEPLIDAVLTVSGDIPVIVLTGYSDLNFSVKSLSKGVSDYLLKDELTPLLLHKSIIYSIERSQFSEKIKKSEENYRKLFEFSPSPMWVYDVESLRFLDVNEAAIRHYGFTKEEFMKMTIRDIRPPDAQDQLDKSIEETLRHPEKKYLGVNNHWKKSGEIIRVEIESSSLEIEGRDARLILADDITEKLKEEERLKLLESVITNSTEAVIILEPELTFEAGRRIVFVNEGFTAITGYKPEEVVGETIHFLNGPKTDEEKLRDIRERMERWEIIDVELINYRKDGSEFWVNTTLVPIKDDKGYSHWVIIGRDISERKKYERQLQASIQEKEVLLSEIHHRVKNNLAVVSSMMQLQAFQEENEELQKKLVDSTFRIRTMATIHELLYQSKSYSRLRFSEIIEELTSNIDEVLSGGKNVNYEIKSVDLELNINQAIPCALIINEVVTNIYKHALSVKQSVEVHIDLQSDGKEIELKITDSGPGLPEGFDPDQTGSLGMNIIQVLSSQLGAETRYESSEKGTTFRLTFLKRDIPGIGSAKVR
jgi:PAS domain S-box-containing protein